LFIIKADEANKQMLKKSSSWYFIEKTAAHIDDSLRRRADERK
ncbi:hypothetical protein CEXT_146571, partial [Caerostris extrusa]